MLRLS